MALFSWVSRFMSISNLFAAIARSFSRLFILLSRHAMATHALLLAMEVILFLYSFHSVCGLFPFMFVGYLYSCCSDSCL